MKCNKPPKYWACSRPAGHEGPCATYYVGAPFWKFWTPRSGVSGGILGGLILIGLFFLVRHFLK